MIWRPQAVEEKKHKDVAFHVTRDLHLYLKRMALNQTLVNDPVWPVEFGSQPTFGDGGCVYFGHEGVQEGDWLIGTIGATRFKVISNVLFERAYRVVSE